MFEASETLLTHKQLAALFGVPAKWLASELEAGHLPGLQADSVWLCDRYAVEAALVQRARDSAKNDTEPFQ